MRILLRSLFCIAPTALAVFVLAVPASAAPDRAGGAAGLTSPSLLAVIANDDLFSIMNLSPVLDPTGSTPTQHYGSYPSGSPDSGTCGNDWATDTFDRDFTVRSNHDGTYTVV